MSRILIAECKQEVSTFNPHMSTYADFKIRRGEEMLTYHRSVRNEVGGALSVFDQTPSIELVPTYSALFITSGGTLEAPSWKRIADEFLDSIRNCGAGFQPASGAPPIDGVYFCMHGAMASTDESDPEGYLLHETRKILGEKIPIVVSLDLHGILTDRMLEHSDAIVAYHTYPHVDFFETGERAARLLLKILAGGIRPITAKVAIPALVRGDELITATGLFGESMRLAQASEKSSGLSAGIFIGNPFTDVPALQTYTFVVTNDDKPKAEREALAIAENFWSHHEKMIVPLVSLDEMAQIANSCGAGFQPASHVTNSCGAGFQPASHGTLALVDAADATSSGASGDSNAILRKLLEANYKGSVLVPIVDEPCVKQAFAAGIGATINTHIGGTLDPHRFQPLRIEARIKLLADGKIRSESFGEHWDAGPTAVLESNRVTLVVSSRAVHLFDRAFFYAHGQDPKRYDAVVVKSPQCEHRMYRAWCAQMVNVDAPGATSANVKSLGHTRSPRPLFPLDENVKFQPNVKFFQRR